ncbi:hypothetical protein N7457_008015 [Penicillium paradoxum]|uniref:uncharacterized protein n=1 Tax=Penicillium paradoxum TaxID=176176 RepID=UPI002548BC3D|nr:uncharacterized protein N7457_008015 [Penicillium paradoxum]KAJ5773119.1 hypothetical protein N7457_008015 [Penicillium paradoxum]
MAAPPRVTIEHLSGEWILNKALTSETDPILKLQKVSWLLRKAFGLATIYLQISQSKPASDTDPATRIDFTQTASAGLAGTKEERVLDWKIADHEDYFFGVVQGQCEFVHGVTDHDGIIRPDFELLTSEVNDQIKQYLRGEIEVDGSKSAGFLVEEQSEMPEKGPGLWVHTSEKNVKAGWTAEQIWGFEMIGEVRYFSRRVVVMTTKGQYICGKLVFDFVSN